MKPLIKDTLKEDKPPNKEVLLYTLKRTTSLQMAGPEGVLIKRFHCIMSRAR